VLAIRSAIKRGETTERAAYLDYASTAARPYARSTFALMLKRQEPEREDGEALTCADVLDRCRERSPVKPKILSLSPGGGLRVQAGALKVFDGGLTLTYARSAKPPLAIVLSSAGGYVSMEAVRFCARANVAIVALDRSHVFLTLIGGSMQANAAMLRAQVCIEPLPIARMIVAAKIESMARVGALSECGRFVTAFVTSVGDVEWVSSTSTPISIDSTTGRYRFVATRWRKIFSWFGEFTPVQWGAMGDYFCHRIGRELPPPGAQGIVLDFAKTPLTGLQEDDVATTNRRWAAACPTKFDGLNVPRNQAAAD
jgi:hypothetical protein